VSSKIPTLAAFLIVAAVAIVPKAEVMRTDLGPTLESLHDGLQTMLQEVDVSPIQILMIRRILLSELDQLDHGRLSSNLSLEQAQLRERAIQAESRRQIDSILSPRQRLELDDISRRRQQKRPEEIGGGTEQK
jgi:hypothetical protein